LLSQVLAGGKDAAARRTRIFALGVTGALALKPRLVHVESGGLAVDLHPPDRVEVREEKTRPGTFVHVRQSFGWWVLRNAVLGAREAVVIKERCARFPVPLTVNGEKVNREGAFAEPVLAFDGNQGDGWRVAAALPARALALSEITWRVQGVDV